MAKSEKSAGGGTGSDSTVQTGMRDQHLAHLQVQQARMLLEEIAAQAHRLRELGHRIVSGEKRELDGSTVAILAAHVGWMADLGSTKLGGCVLLGEPEDWLLTPNYLSVTARAEVQEGADHG